MKHINLETFANGAFTAQVNRAFREVIENIQDPNTEARAARKITITIGIKPNSDRSFGSTGIQTKTTLAPALGAVTAIQMGKDLRTGEVEAVEMGTGQIPGQLSVAEIPGVVPEAKAYDPETGEILENADAHHQSGNGTIVDMRRKA